jgi:hypothetical protein
VLPRFGLSERITGQMRVGPLDDSPFFVDRPAGSHGIRAMLI